MSYIDSVITGGKVHRRLSKGIGEVKGDVRDKFGNPIKLHDRVYFNGSKGLVIGHVIRGKSWVNTKDWRNYNYKSHTYPDLPEHKWTYHSYVTVRVTYTEDKSYGNASVNVNSSNVVIDNGDK